MLPYSPKGLFQDSSAFDFSVECSHEATQCISGPIGKLVPAALHIPFSGATRQVYFNAAFVPIADITLSDARNTLSAHPGAT